MIELSNKHFHRVGREVIIKHPQFKEKHGMVAVLSDSCGYCVVFKPEYEKTANITGDVYPMAFIDPHKNRETMELLHVFGYPTVFYVNRGVVGDRYEGDRTSDSLMRHICRHSQQNPRLCRK